MNLWQQLRRRWLRWIWRQRRDRKTGRLATLTRQVEFYAGQRESALLEHSALRKRIATLQDDASSARAQLRLIDTRRFDTADSSTWPPREGWYHVYRGKSYGWESCHWDGNHTRQQWGVWTDLVTHWRAMPPAPLDRARQEVAR